MDEWIGAGDPNFQDKARRRMNEMAEKAGIIVLASHNHGLLRKTCNKVLELQEARLKAFCKTEDWFGKQQAGPDQGRLQPAPQRRVV